MLSGLIILFNAAFRKKQTTVCPKTKTRVSVWGGGPVHVEFFWLQQQAGVSFRQKEVLGLV